MRGHRTESRRSRAWGPRLANSSAPASVYLCGMGTNNVISLTQRRAAKLAAEISSPKLFLDPMADETVDEFIERVGNAIAELIGRDTADGRRS